MTAQCRSRGAERVVSIAMNGWIGAWAERSRRRQWRTLFVCLLIVLALTTLDQPGLAIFTVDGLAVIVLILWLRLRRLAGTATASRESILQHPRSDRAH